MQCTAAVSSRLRGAGPGRDPRRSRERYPECVIGYSGHDNSISMRVRGADARGPDHPRSISR